MGTHLKADKDYKMAPSRTKIPKKYMELIGTMTDAELSRLSGISHQTLRSRRIELGIPRHIKQKTEHRPCFMLNGDGTGNIDVINKKYPGIVDKLGFQTDSSIGRQYNLSRERVRQFRDMLFLGKAKSKNPIENLSEVDRKYLDDNLGRVYDRELSRQLGLGVAVVFNYRTSRNIPSVPENRKRLVLAQQHRMGVDSDAVIARHLNVPTALVMRTRNELGIKPNPKHNPRWGSVAAIRENRKKKIAQMFYSGASDKEIAKDLCVSRNYIGILRRRLGLRRRKDYKKRASNE